MGTSLTGLTPATTYDALIKVGDNGALSATAKFLSDGLGNDSTLALSTGSVGIGTSTPVGLFHIEGANPNSNNIASSGNAVSRLADSATSATRKELTTILDTTNNRVDIQAIHQGVQTLPITINASGGNVGIGTTSPSAKLHVAGSESGASPSALVRVGNTGAGNTARIILTDETTADGNIVFKGSASGSAFQYIGLGISAFDVLKITGDNYLRMASGTGGIQFNGDTAATNALDDYEEGTWTMGISFGGASVGVTYSGNTGTYTKIGRQVTVNGYIYLSSKGSSTGAANVTGLPFTIPNNSINYSAVTIWYIGVTFTGQQQAYGQIGGTSIILNTLTGGTFAQLTDTAFTTSNSELMVSMTYFV